MDASEKEFEQLASFVGFYATQVWKIPPEAESHPLNVLASGKGRVANSKLLAGLKQAVNDVVQDSRNYSPEQVAALDRACYESGVLTLSEARRRFSKEYWAILRAERITSDTEYYLVVGILNDANNSISEAERDLLEKLVVLYEERQSKT